MGGYPFDDWPRYVPVAQRRRRAAQKIAKLKKAGRNVSPVEIEGRKVTRTFWGDAWCKNLEAYSDYSNRLPRGRTYVRNGSVVDLQIEAGRVRALVSGTDLYSVGISIKPLPEKAWKEIKGRCAGQIDSLVELLRGSISKGVMEIVTRKGDGLFPSPREITLNCSCPDWASMCKHVAATLYGVGARLDIEPELLFTLRDVDPAEMIEAAIDQPTGAGKTRKGRLLETDELSSLFGVDIGTDMDRVGVFPEGTSRKTKAKPRTSSQSATAKQTAAKKKNTPQNATTQKASAKKSNTKKTSAKKPAAKKTLAKTSSAKESSSERTAHTGKTAAKRAP